jgi:lactoylglutathione lyase
LATTDFDEVTNTLLKLNIEYSDWPGTPNKNYVRKDGVKQLYFQDPDGYWIEINNDV